MMYYKVILSGRFYYWTKTKKMTLSKKKTIFLGNLTWSISELSLTLICRLSRMSANRVVVKWTCVWRFSKRVTFFQNWKICLFQAIKF